MKPSPLEHQSLPCSFMQDRRIPVMMLVLVMSLGIALGQTGGQNHANSVPRVHRSQGEVILRVKDATGARIPNARIRLFSSQGKEIRSGATNKIGELRFANLSRGFYIAEVSMRGFQVCRKELKIKTDALANVEVKLEVGAESQTIDIFAHAPEIEVENAPATQLQFVQPRYLFPENRLNFLVASR